MVCSIENGRMAVMARLIDAGKLSQKKAGEIGQHKLAVQHIHRELREANEPNLLDEEDMHIFGLKPMVDPLHLVCCNACKKPIKASQYAVHAELCSSLRTTEESALEIDGGLGRRKPPRKERKKPAYTNQPTPVLEQERYELINVDDSTTSKPHANGKIAYSFSMDSKRNSAIVDKESMMDNLGANHESRDHSASVVLPSAKRSKLIAGGECMLPLEVPENASGLTRIQNTQDIYASKGSSGRRISGSKIPNDIRENCGQVHKQCLQTKSVPVPLATKIYYSQRSSRLRLAISHQYHDAWANELSSDGQASQQNMMLLKTSSQVSSLEQVNDLLFKEKGPPPQKPDQTVAQSSEVCLSDSGKPPSSNFSNQLPLDNVPRSQAASVGFTRSRYPYNFSGNSGELMGTMQQPNGSVPVV